MMDRRAPYSPPDCLPTDVREPWDAEPSPTAARSVFAFLVCGAVVAGLIAAFIAIATS